ncbi:UNVERIFIED_CONTAM: hypothetical protein PYX00_003282 [Menopon gallinae]|uniref:Cilia- and flagella-associated protein 298 n=1 Tax=Menopon gallinae TaxID=328185 RepID=A0AAW2HZW0_9NEOP
MVRLHVKKGNESHFLYDTTLDTEVDKLIEEVTHIYNGRLKISRICYELEELVKHGTLFPPEILGLTPEQVEELHLVDDWGEKCVPSGGWTMNKDPIGRRNGRQPTEAMQKVLNNTMDEAKALVSKKQIDNDVCVTFKMVQSALDMLKGAVMIVYPMGLPPHDTIRQEIENTEDLSGTQASLDVLEASRTSVWFCGKEMMRGKKLRDYLGNNEKTKGIIKLQKAGSGAPQREPVMSEEDQKAMMLHAYRRQEELKVGLLILYNFHFNSHWYYQMPILTF